jgi:hypothetical protein
MPMRKPLSPWILRLTRLLLVLLIISAALPFPKGQAVAQPQASAGSVYLPVLFSTPHPARTINAPYFDTSPVSFIQSAIAWFGKVDNTTNYTDVRVGYNDNELKVDLHTFDRRLWGNTNPNPATLNQYDSATFYLDLDGNTGNVPSTHAYRFEVQLNWFEVQGKYQFGYKGDGSSWQPFTGAFTAVSSYNGVNGPNTNGDADGWYSTFTIPFSSLGLSGPPAQGTQWGLGLAVHDRDDAAGTAIPDQTWPEGISGGKPSTWGRVNFGLPTYTAPNKPPAGTTTLRDKLNGAAVTDAAVGGTMGNLCNGTDKWTKWGNANFAGADTINIQNQFALGDWPCFSKYYITLPLDNIPPGKVILSARLTMYLRGGSDPSEAKPSLIQVLSLSDDWNEGTLTWNNAPLAMENVSRVWVDPAPNPFVWPPPSYTWDVTYALAKAYNSGQPLRLAMYSADWDMHSGKYFYSSEQSDIDAFLRPTVEVTWAEP